jgi:hypothetical protein
MKREISNPKYARQWLQAIEVPPRAQWCTAGEYCKNYAICSLMHQYTWNGFPSEYHENFHKYVAIADEIQVNPDLEPLWSAPSSKLGRKDTIEYMSCFYGSRCKNVMAGRCKRLHPRQTEIIAAITSQEKERPYRQEPARRSAIEGRHFTSPSMRRQDTRRDTVRTAYHEDTQINDTKATTPIGKSQREGSGYAREQDPRYRR